VRRLGVARPSGAAFGIALRGHWKLGAWFLGGAQGRGVRDPHRGVASTTPAAGSATSAPRQNAGTDRASWSRRYETPQDRRSATRLGGTFGSRDPCAEFRAVVSFGSCPSHRRGP